MLLGNILCIYAIALNILVVRYLIASSGSSLIIRPLMQSYPGDFFTSRDLMPQYLILILFWFVEISSGSSLGASSFEVNTF